eukprot:3793183-Pleurochrysis_carterae.AAC.1
MLRGLARTHAERGRVAYAVWARARIAAQEDNTHLCARRTPASGTLRARGGAGSTFACGYCCRMRSAE